MTKTNIPIFDLTQYYKGSIPEKAKLCREIGAACESIGVFTVVGHRVPKRLIEGMFTTSSCFFDLSIEEKLKVAVNGDGVGYVPFETEALAASHGHDTPPDLKESLNTGSDFQHNRWPECPTELRSIWIEYFANMASLSRDLLRIFAIALNLPEIFFDEKISAALAFLRVARYPKQESQPRLRQLRAGEHTDYGTLTIVRPDGDAGGLQVSFGPGEWIDVRAEPESLIINIGDMMQYWTNDIWRSALHRVTNPPASLRHTRRQSLIFFHNPNAKTIISCLPTCVSPERPARYPDIEAEQYLRSKSQAAGTYNAASRNRDQS